MLYKLWLPVILLAGTGIITFLITLLLQRKPKLTYKISQPSIFYEGKNKVTYQNLELINTGKVSLRNIKVSFNAKKFDKIEYSVVVSGVREGIETIRDIKYLKFETLTPKHKILISFRISESSEIDNIEEVFIEAFSNETIGSVKETSAISTQYLVGSIIASVFAVLTVAYIFFNIRNIKSMKTLQDEVMKEGSKVFKYELNEFKKDDPNIIESFILDKDVYEPGDTAKLTISFENNSIFTLSNFNASIIITGLVSFPGYNSHSFNEKYIKPGETVYKIIPIPIIPKKSQGYCYLRGHYSYSLLKPYFKSLEFKMINIKIKREAS